MNREECLAAVVQLAESLETVRQQAKVLRRNVGVLDAAERSWLEFIEDDAAKGIGHLSRPGLFQPHLF